MLDDNRGAASNVAGLRPLIVAFMSGVSLFAIGVAFLVLQGFVSGDGELTPMFAGIAGLIGLGALAAVLVMRRLPIGQGATEAEFAQFTLIRAAFAEGFGLFTTVSALITNDLTFLIGSAVSVALLFALLRETNGWRPAGEARVEPDGQSPIEP